MADDELRVTSEKGWHYTIVENAILDDSLHFEKPHEKLLYIALCRFANLHTGQAYPSIAKLAQMCHCSERTVLYAIKRLEELGLVLKQSRKDDGMTNVYRLLEIPNEITGGTQEVQGGMQDVHTGYAPHAYQVRTTCVQTIESELEKVDERKERVYAHSPRVKFAEFVTMTEAEHQKLVDQYGTERTQRMIEVLDNYKGANGKRYKSDYRAILNWVADKVVNGEVGNREHLRANSGAGQGKSARKPPEQSITGGRIGWINRPTDL